jgi:hypothetical protein
MNNTNARVKNGRGGARTRNSSCRAIIVKQPVEAAVDNVRALERSVSVLLFLFGGRAVGGIFHTLGVTGRR